MSSHFEEADLDLFEGLDEKSLAGADFTAEVIGELRRAFSEVRSSSDLTQKAVADRLGVSKSAVHRWLYGDGNMTVRKLGELVWAMGCRSAFTITADLDPLGDVQEGMCQTEKTPTNDGVVAVPTPTNLEGQFYQLTPITLKDAAAAQATGAPLRLSGYTKDIFVRGNIVPTGRNCAIAQFDGIDIGIRTQNFSPMDGFAIEQKHAIEVNPHFEMLAEIKNRRESGLV